jgi:hypothetical protein
MTNINGTSALVIAPDPREMAMLATVMRQALLEMRTNLLKPGVDYGIIPGTKKDTLLKPGAEKLASGFKLYPIPKLLTTVEDWNAGFFYYRYQIDLMHRETGQVWGTGIGSCNSREKKYGYRWVTEAEVPANLDKETLVREDGMQTLTEFDFAVKQAKTSGQYAKSAEHWQMFKDAIESGKAKKIQKETKTGKSDAWEITAGVVKYRVPNPEIYDQVNTIDKMAFKRAYVAAVLNATNASEFFTQDMEDFMSIALPDEDENVVEGVVTEITAAPVVVEDKKPKTAKECLSDGDCKKKFEDICRELAIKTTIDHAPYLAALGNLKAYSDFEGTFDSLCEKMRAIHKAINTPGIDPATAATASITTQEAAAKLGKGDKTPIGREPVTIVGNSEEPPPPNYDDSYLPHSSKVTNAGGNITTNKVEYNGKQVYVRIPNTNNVIPCGSKDGFIGWLDKSEVGFAAMNDVPAWKGDTTNPKKEFTLSSDIKVQYEVVNNVNVLVAIEVVSEPVPMGGQVL